MLAARWLLSVCCLVFPRWSTKLNKPSALKTSPTSSKDTLSPYFWLFCTANSTHFQIKFQLPNQCLTWFTSSGYWCTATTWYFFVGCWFWRLLAVWFSVPMQITGSSSIFQNLLLVSHVPSMIRIMWAIMHQPLCALRFTLCPNQTCSET